MTKTTEDELFESYRRGCRYEAPCACGVVITSPSASERDVAAAIDSHNKSTVHQLWGEWQEALLEARAA